MTATSEEDKVLDEALVRLDLVKIAVVVIGLGAGCLAGAVYGDNLGVGVWLLSTGVLYAARVLWEERQKKLPNRFGEKIAELERQVKALQSK